jgi:DNA-binding XRE family transcriptional regulator
MKLELKKFGPALKLLRIERGYSQADFAAACGWARNSGRISQYETGRRTPSPDDVRTMAKVLGVSASKLQFPDENDSVSKSTPGRLVQRGPGKSRVPVVTMAVAARRLRQAHKLVMARATERDLDVDDERLDVAVGLYMEYDSARNAALRDLLGETASDAPTPSPDLAVVDWALETATDEDISAIRQRMFDE